MWSPPWLARFISDKEETQREWKQFLRVQDHELQADARARERRWRRKKELEINGSFVVANGLFTLGTENTPAGPRENPSFNRPKRMEGSWDKSKIESMPGMRIT